MVKLKTLKDLSVEEWKDRKEFVELWVKVEEIKQEAIRWVKDYSEDWVKLMVDSGEVKSREDVYHISPQCHIFMKFFNITDEDLK